MKRARRDKQNEIGADNAVFRLNSAAFDNGKDVSLNALSRYVGSLSVAARRNFIDFVDENYAVLFGSSQRLRRYAVAVNQFRAFFGNENIPCLFDGNGAHFLFLRHKISENAADIYFLSLSDVDLHIFRFVDGLDRHLQFVEIALSEFLQYFLFQRGVGFVASRLFAYRQNYIDEFLFDDVGNFRLNFLEFFFADEPYRRLDKVAHDAFDVASDVADFGKLSGFHLDERRLYEPCEPSCDFGFTYSRRAFHYNVFGRYFFAKFFGQSAASVSVAQRDCNRFFRLVLTYNITVEFAHNLFRGKFHLCLQYLDRKTVVGVNAKVACDFHGAADDFLGAELGIFIQRSRRGVCVITAASYRGNSSLGLDNLARAAYDKHYVLIGNNHHRFQFSCLIVSPQFGKFYRGAHKIAAVFLQHFFKFFAQCKRVADRPREAYHYFIVENSFYFYRIALENHAFAHGNLSVAGDCGYAVFLNGAYSSSFKSGHFFSLMPSGFSLT